MQIPQKIIGQRKDYIPFRTDSVSQQINNALRSPANYKAYEDENTMRYMSKGFHKNKGQFTLDITGIEEPWQEIQNALTTLGDEAIDTYYATMAMALDENGIENISRDFMLNTDDILALCGKEKSNGSYTPGQRAEVIKHLKTLALCRVTASFPAPAQPGQKRKRGRPRRGEVRNQAGETMIVVEGSLINLLDFKIGEYNTITGEELWARHSVAIGKWAKAYPGLGQQTGIMLRRVLKYSAKNQRYQKRIGLYLSAKFRTNAWNSGRFPNDISMRALLDGAGITPDYHRPGEFKEALERALERLKQDGVIGNYVQVINSNASAAEIETEIRERAYGWFDLWLENKWNFSPPETVLNHYQKLAKPAPQEAPKDK